MLSLSLLSECNKFPTRLKHQQETDVSRKLEQMGLREKDESRVTIASIEDKLRGLSRIKKPRATYS